MAEEFIRSHDGATPAFKGLYGFPGTRLHVDQPGDRARHSVEEARAAARATSLSIDVGVRLKGYFTDSATTVPVGEVDAESQRLLDGDGARRSRPGSPRRRPGNHIGDIGAAVQAVVEGAGFSVVRDLVGHGIGTEFHEEPQVPNYGKPKRADEAAPGLTIAIEPMVNVGAPQTRTMPDRWTVVTADGSRVGALRAHDRDHGRGAAGV